MDELKERYWFGAMAALQDYWLERAAQICLESKLESGCEGCTYHRDGVYGGCKIGWPYEWEV
jgi:hypothetical protein